MDYIYAVSRIRCHEMSLLSSLVMEQLLSCKTYNDCLAILEEKGWGDAEKSEDADAMLDAELKKTWDLIRELTEDMSVFDVFLYGNDFHNLKTALKLKYYRDGAKDAFISQGTVDPQMIKNTVDSGEYDLLPENMQESARDAAQALAEMNEPQLCDIILDKAALEAIYKAGKLSRDDVIKDYSEVTVAMADIKTAVRAAKAAKSQTYIKNALASCDSLDTDRLSSAAAKGMEEISNYLKVTSYAKVGETLSEGVSKCEKLLDDMLIERIKAQKYVTEGTGPLAAYILARENEIRNVRLILAGKKNNLDENVIRERLRQTYV